MSTVKHIVYHADLDGVMTAALLLPLIKNGDYRLHMMLSSSRGKRFEEVLKGMPKDDHVSIVDYSYSKRANLWVDHHYNKSMPAPISQNGVIFDSSYKSCFSLLLDNTRALDQNHFDVSNNIINKARKHSGDVDMIDSCGYISAEYIFNSTDPLMILRAYIESSFPNEHLFSRIVEIIAMTKFNIPRALEILNITKYSVLKIKASARSIRKDMLIEMDSVSFVSQSRANKYPRYAEALVAPEVMYNVRITKISENTSLIGMSYNPWGDRKNRIHIGRFLMTAKNMLNAGGHKDVGGGQMRTEYINNFMADLSISIAEQEKEM